MLKLLMLLGAQGISAFMTKAQLRRSLANLATLAAALLAIVTLAAIGLGFAVAALYLWLDRHLDSHWAALLTAGLMLLSAGSGLLALRWTSRRSRHRSRPSAAEATSDMAGAFTDSVARQPRTALMLALATGLSLGLWLR